MCHLSEDLSVIVKECFPTLILQCFPSINWADFGLIYIFDKNVPGDWGGSVTKLFHIDMCLNQALVLCFKNMLWTLFFYFLFFTPTYLTSFMTFLYK